MSYTYGFFDAVDLGSGNYDRVYSSAEFSHYWALLVGDGVFGQPSTSLNVLAMEPVAMKVKVAPGTGWIKGHYLTVPDNMDEVIAVPVANPTLPRIDSIIMALNNTDRDMKLYVRSGTAAASPKAVTLQRDADVWELELAQITVAAGAGNITQQAIKDMRTDPDRCGIVTGLIDQFDVSGFLTAAQASFDEWFEDVKGQLGDDVAGNLLNLINGLQESKLDVSAKASTSEATAGTNDTKYMTPLSTKTAARVHAFKVGDTLDSWRTDLGNNWRNCNGDFFAQSDFPALAPLMPGYQTMFTQKVMKSLPITFPNSRATYKELNGYQLVAAAAGSSGMYLYYSTDDWATYQRVQITTSSSDSSDRFMYPNIFYANGYWIYVWSGGGSTPGALYVYYSTSLSSGWTQGANDSGDFYGGTGGFGRFFDLIYQGGKYVLLTEQTKDTDPGNYYIGQLSSTHPSFKRTYVTQNIGGTRINVFAFYRTSTQIVYLGYYNRTYYCQYANISTPMAYTLTTFTVSGASLNSPTRDSLVYLDGRYVWLGYKDNSPVICYSNSPSFTTWTAVSITSPGSNSYYKPQGVLFKHRDYYIIPGEYFWGTSSYCGYYIGTSLTSSAGWQWVSTRDPEAPASNYQIDSRSGVISHEEYVSFVAGAYLVEIPYYALPLVDIAPLYKYIKVKEGI